MRPSFSNMVSLPFFFFLVSFFLGCSLCTVVATSTPPSMAPTPSPSGFHPADTIEEACHLMVDVYEAWSWWYPYCVTALRLNPESRNATIHKLAVLAAEITLQDALVELRRMEVMKSRGVGDQQELDDCMSGFHMFIPIIRGGIKDLQKDGRIGFQFFFNDIRDYVYCGEEHPSPVKKQMEIVALINALFGICNKYCRYPAPKPCRFW